MTTIQVPREYSGQRIDQVLAILHPVYSRSQYQQALQNGYIALDSQPVYKSKTKVLTGQMIDIRWEAQVPIEKILPEKIPIPVIYEDESVLVVNKAAGMVVHPGAGNLQGTLVNALLYYYPALMHIPRAGLIHRLDKDTTGLLIVGKTMPAYEALIEAMKARSIRREYQALVHGRVTQPGTVNAPIARHPRQRTKMAVSSTGRSAVTHYSVSQLFQTQRLYSLLHIQLESGRTHQIRVHMQHIRHPIVGDPLYNKKKPGWLMFDRQALHAFQLTFTHPITQKRILCHVPLPLDMQNLINLLRHTSN